ncbi:MAG: flagellar basal body P-ring protein FlgI [Phycisphaeraceae bacterium]|nr:flagellar basal body P-ring protein FlgI [Phycisphaerae bacterium]MBX3393043.1 flagellar basal body P-ring protein FlgI [Phycisphaeraceae bacterium]
MSVRAVLCLTLAVVMIASRATGTTVKELVRLRGQGESVLRGTGLVVGLPGTGDSGKEPALARPLAEFHKNSGNAIGRLEELATTRSVALVSLSCVIPEGGARADDTIDVHVSTLGTAKSLKGGRLILSPLIGPYKGDPVYAMAEGAISIEDGSTPTSARVRLGARMLEDIAMPPVGDSFDLVIRPAFAGWSSATQIAASIESLYRADPMSGGPTVARAIDERTVRVFVPEAERVDRAAFVADVMSADVNTALLRLPAMVVVNPADGSIVMTADVQIGAVAITHKDLTITTTIPAPQPTAFDPLVDRTRWTGVQAPAAAGGNAKLSDLLAAFKQLDIPVQDQIDVLQMIQKAGKLHAKLVID